MVEGWGGKGCRGGRRHQGPRVSGCETGSLREQDTGLKLRRSVFSETITKGQKEKCLILSSARDSKCPLKLLLPFVILKDSSMTLEVDTKEKGLDTVSHNLQRPQKKAPDTT